MKLKFFQRWWAKATPEQKTALAKEAGSSYQSLHNAAKGWKNIAPERAGRIEKATHGALRRGELSVTCAGCRYYRETVKAEKGEGK